MNLIIALRGARRYHPSARAEIVRVLALLGADDPRALMRTAEPRYRELGLGRPTRTRLSMP